jgi:hypothetical protein
MDHPEVGVVKDIGGSGWGHGTSLDDAVKIKNICGYPEIIPATGRIY